jgi:flagellin
MTLALNFNYAAVRAQYNLQNADKLLSQSVERLSSGTRITLAKDDPAGMVLANGMRHHLAGLNQALSNVEESVTMVQTAEAGMDQISSLLTRIRTLAVNAANNGIQDDSTLGALQTELDDAVSSISRIASDTQFGSRKLLQGGMADITLPTATKIDYRNVSWDATRIPGGIQTDSTLSIAPPSSATLDHDRIAITFAGSPAGTATITGQTQGGVLLDSVAGQTITIEGATGTKAITLAAGTTINDFVAQVNASTKTTGARAAYDSATGTLTVESTTFGVGPLHIVSQGMSTGSPTVGLLDTDTTGIANPLEATRDAFSMTLQTAASGIPATTDTIRNLVDTGTSTAFNAVLDKTVTIYGKGESATLKLTDSTTIQDVLDWANNYHTKLGVTASYDSTTGALSFVGEDSPITVSSDSLATTGTVGLLDRDTSTITSTGSGALSTRTGTSSNATLDVTFTDAAGTSHTVTLTQVPSSATVGNNSEGGLTFTNLLPGPELNGSYFTGWKPGALSVTVKDTSTGLIGGTITSPTTTRTATRTSSTFVQSGALSGQSLTIEVPDVRAGALGYTAGLANKGLGSIQDLVDTQALVKGNAQDAMRVIDAAIDEVATARGKLGAIEANGLETAATSMQVTMQNLTTAESQIRDTDFAQESANMTRNNILYQAATAMLSQANQIPQTVLEMLKR